MAKLGRFDWTVTDSAGNALSGVSVEIRRQGATVNGDQSGTSPITVNDPGAVVSGDQIRIGTDTTVTRTASTPTATSVTFTGGKFPNLTDDDRITIASTLPTIYNDAEGAEVLSNPLTTSSLGQVTCWLTGGYYDVLVSGGSATTKLYQDVWIGAESETSNEFDAAAAVAFIKNSGRTLSTSGALLEDWRNNSDSKFKIGYDGSITATGSSYTYGTASAAGFYSPVGNFVNATCSGFYASGCHSRRFIGNLGSLVATGNWSISAAWGSTATYSIPSQSTDTRGGITIIASGAGITDNPTATLTFADGAGPGSVYATVSRYTNSAAPTGAGFIVSNTASTLLQLTFTGLPVAGNSYSAFYHVIF